MTWLLVAALGDGVTMLLLPHGGELNPVARTAPYLALGLKLALTLVLAGLASRPVLARVFGRVVQVAAGLWTVGLASNLLTIAWHR